MNLESYNVPSDFEEVVQMFIRIGDKVFSKFHRFLVELPKSK